MLMQNFKSAVDLGISEPQRDALQKTLVLLETGKLKFAPAGLSPDNSSSEFTGHFNMQWFNKRDECGTVCCICGTAELIGDVEFGPLKYELNDLNALFFGDGKTSVPLYDIRPEQAARALRSYLTTGDANWKDACA